MKRALLIATGTVGGLGAVLAITPPQLGNQSSLIAGAGASTLDSGTQAQEQSTQGQSNSSGANNSSAASGNASKNNSSSKSSSTKKSATKSTSSNGSNSAGSSNNSTSSSGSSSSQKNNSNAAPAGNSGSFTGDAVDVGYGIVQVKITISNGQITDAVALQAPSGRNQSWTDRALPYLRSQTLQAQSAAINGVSGASYTSYGWYKSLISALQKAGMTTGV